MRSGARRLVDAAHEGLGLENRFDLACNTGHALAPAALRIRDCRSESRYLVFQCLQHTIGLPPEQWRILDQPHGRRVESLLARTLPFVVWSGMGSVGHSMVVIHQNSEFRAAFRGLCRIGCHSRFS